MFMLLTWWILRFGCGSFFCTSSIRKDLQVFIGSLLQFQLLQSHHDVLLVAEKKNQQLMHRIRHLQRCSPAFTPRISSNWLPTYCLHTMADMLVVACCGTTWRDAPDVLRNLAVDFSSIELLPSPAIPKSAVDSHGKRTGLVIRLLPCTCILVIS